MICLHLSLGGYGHFTGCTDCIPCTRCPERVLVEFWNDHQREHDGLPARQPLHQEFLERCDVEISQPDLDKIPFAEEIQEMVANPAITPPKPEDQVGGPLSEEFLTRCREQTETPEFQRGMEENPLVREAQEMSRPLTGAELNIRMTE